MYKRQEVGRGLKRALQEFGDDGLTLMISEFDVEKPSEQLAAVEEMRQQGIDSFILSYSSHEVILQILERLEKENCRVVLLSRDVAEHPDNYYVGVDYYRSGMLAAELLMKLMPEGGRIFVPVTEEYKTNQDILSRLSGFQDRLKTCEKLEMLPPFFGLTGEREIKEDVYKRQLSLLFLDKVALLYFHLSIFGRHITSDQLGRLIKGFVIRIHGNLCQDRGDGLADSPRKQLSLQGILDLSLIHI